MKYSWTVFLVFLSLSSRHGDASQIVLFPAPEFSNREMSYLLEQDSDLVRYSQHFKRSQPQISRQIAESYSSGKMSLLHGDSASATHQLKKVFEVYAKAPFLNPETLNLVGDALLLLAQHTSTIQEKTYWQTEHQRLQILTGGAIQSPEMTVFNEEPPTFAWAPYQKLRAFDWLIINGVLFEMGPNLKIQLTPGSYHVTALSDRYQPVRIQAKHTRIMDWEPEEVSFVAGDCYQPEVQSALNDIFEYELSFSHQCRLRYRGPLQERYMADKGVFLASNELTLPKPPADRLPPQVNNPQWILAAGALTAGVLISLKLSGKQIVVEKPSW